MSIWEKIPCRSFYTSELLILELLRMMCYSVSDTIQAYSEKNLNAPITGVLPKTFRLDWFGCSTTELQETRGS